MVQPSFGVQPNILLGGRLGGKIEIVHICGAQSPALFILGSPAATSTTLPSLRIQNVALPKHSSTTHLGQPYSIQDDPRIQPVAPPVCHVQPVISLDPGIQLASPSGPQNRGNSPAQLESLTDSSLPMVNTMGSSKIPVLPK